MTGTASEIYNHIEDTAEPEFITGDQDWLFNRIHPDCILSDISYCGSSLVAPVDLHTPESVYSLLIMQPGNDTVIHTILTAELRWTNEQYSTSHKKIGFKFLDVDSEDKDKIKTLARNFKPFSNPGIKCCLIKS